MLKFFRQIRKSLINKSRLTKYSLYAIGEIFLVVIGILIALQINNWNSQRKDREKERSYIISLLVDLEEDKKELDRFAEDVDLIWEKLMDLRQFYERDLTLPLNVDSLHLLHREAMRVRTWPHNDRTLNQLESTGEYILIRSNIGDSLSVYKTLVKGQKQQEEACREIHRNSNYFSNKFLHKHLSSNTNKEYISDGVLTGKHFPPIQDSDILKTEFFNYIDFYQGCMGYNLHVRARRISEFLERFIPYLKEEYEL